VLVTAFQCLGPGGAQLFHQWRVQGPVQRSEPGTGEEGFDLQLISRASQNPSVW